MTATQKFIEEVEARLKAATPTPWRASDPATSHFEVTCEAAPDVTEVYWVAQCQNQADAELITCAPTDLAKALKALETTTDALDSFKLSHLHAPDLPHTRSLGDTYGWCDYCKTSVSWGPGDAETALSQIEEVLK